MTPHRYRARHCPPSWWDRILTRPAEAGMALVWTLVGLIVLASLLLPIRPPSSSLSYLPAALIAVVAALVALGGIGVGWSITTTHPRLDRVWEVETAGLWAGLTGWAGYTIAVGGFHPASAVAWGLGLSQVITAALVLLSLRRDERETRSEVADLEDGPDRPPEAR